MTLEEAMAKLGTLTPLVARLEASLQELQRERDQYKRLAEQLRERCALLERGLVGRKAETQPADEAQLTLAMLGTMLSERERSAIDALAEEAREEEQLVREHTRKKPPGRKALPEELPRVTIEQVPGNRCMSPVFP